MYAMLLNIKQVGANAAWIGLLFISSFVTGATVGDQVFAEGNQPAPLRGVYEVVLTSTQTPTHPFKPGLVQVIFTPPGGKDITVDAFYDGASVFRARAYCEHAGDWTWRCNSQDTFLNGKHGTFTVIESDLPGKLRLHPEDRQQFVFDNGEWFLHIGETGYRYLTTTEKKWKSYIDQAVKMGATKIRTWFCQGRHDVQILFSEERSSLNLAYWQEMDRRLTYALEQYPQIQFQLMPYGEDTEELKRYAAVIKWRNSSHNIPRLVFPHTPMYSGVFPTIVRSSPMARRPEEKSSHQPSIRSLRICAVVSHGGPCLQTISPASKVIIFQMQNGLTLPHLKTWIR